MSEFEYKKIIGKDIEQYFDDICRIRITVFKEWPYLYEGTVEYEREYLTHYFENDRSLCILIIADKKVVGISTSMPLAGEHEEFKKPVADFGFDISKIFYYSETCLLKEHRGKGIYRKIFSLREEHVKSFGDDYHKVCFCSVIRPAEHPLKPKDYRPLEETWKRYEFYKVDGLTMTFLWTDIGENKETRKNLSVWMKDLL